MEREVGCAEHHGDDQDELHAEAVPMTDGSVPGGEATGGGGREGVGNGIEGSHSSRQQANGDEGGEPGVQLPEAGGCIPDAGGQAIHAHARGLGVDEAKAAGPQGWQHRHHEHDDSHAARPLRELPVEQHPGALGADRVVSAEHR